MSHGLILVKEKEGIEKDRRSTLRIITSVADIDESGRILANRPVRMYDRGPQGARNLTARKMQSRDQLRANSKTSTSPDGTVDNNSNAISGTVSAGDTDRIRSKQTLRMLPADRINHNTAATTHCIRRHCYVTVCETRTVAPYC